MAEALVAMLALAALFWAIPLLGRYQDIALDTLHASRTAAFAMTQTDEIDSSVIRHHFAESALRWRDAGGTPLLPDDGIMLRFDRSPLATGAQPGQQDAAARALRHDWQIEDRGIVFATVAVHPRNVLNAPQWHEPHLRIERHTAILAGAGHAMSDQEGQHRIARGTAGWSRAAETSIRAGRTIADAMQAVDAGWHRPSPELDWLSPWAGLVPADRLKRR